MKSRKALGTLAFVFLNLVAHAWLGALVFAGEKFDPARCSEFLTSELRMVSGDFNHPVKYGTVNSGIRRLEEVQTHHLKMMLGQYGSKVDLALYQDAESVLLLSDGKGELKLERLGPVIAKAFPSKTVVSAELNVVQDGFVNNWGFVKVDNLEPFPIRDNAFDRVILKKGMCICHNATCCAGFNPASEEAKKFLKEVVRVLNKKKPTSFAVLNGMNNVGVIDIRVWDKYLFEISRTEPIDYEFMYENGLFHSILIHPKNGRSSF